MKTFVPVLVLSLAALGLAGCDAEPRLETRTFALEHVDAYQIAELIDPYVYGDRPDAPGSISATSGALTVRETADNLDRIARVIDEYDVARPDLRLHFRLIEADGFTGRDERIADVEAELRQAFPFEGYRLVGEAVIAVTDRSEMSQLLGTADGGPWKVSGAVERGPGGVVRLHDVELIGDVWGSVLETTVNVRLGQTLVLGSTPRPGGTSTLFLTVRAEEAG